MPSTRLLAEFDAVRADAMRCTDCDLYKHANQMVFGEGPVPARVMLIGEVPGDKEDKAGHPFVGPAGRILDEALEDAGLDRNRIYLTNAVKHFKFEPRGKVRLHKKPNQTEVAACRQWWEREIALVHPRVIGLLGATAAQAMLGNHFRLTQHRGEWFPVFDTARATATIHPSAVLRAQERRAEEYDGLVRDLRMIAEAI